MKHKQHMIRTNNLLTRIIALVLALIIGILSVPRAVNAMEINEDFNWRDNFENYLEYLKEASLDDSSAVKAGNWGLAHYHDRLPWNYFHNIVQLDIMKSWKPIVQRVRQ